MEDFAKPAIELATPAVGTLGVAAAATGGRGLALDEVSNVPDAAAAPRTYNVSWTSTGTQPSVGDGTLVGNYVRIGRLVHCFITLTWGSTTSNGTGVFVFSTPTQAEINSLLGTAQANDSGSNFGGIVVPASGASVLILNTTDNAAWGAGTPGTLATGDFYRISFTYVAAV